MARTKAIDKSSQPSMWNDFSAFDDLFELEHALEILKDWCAAYPQSNTPAEWIIGERSHLIERLNLQAAATERVLETERPGLYRRTWMAGLFSELFLRLDSLAENPGGMTAEVQWIGEALHKVLIAAHEVFDPHHRKELIAKAIEDSASERGRKAVKARHDAPGGATELKAKARDMYQGGGYGSTKDAAAEAIAKALGVSYSTARKYLRDRR